MSVRKIWKNVISIFTWLSGSKRVLKPYLCQLKVVFSSLFSPLFEIDEWNWMEVKVREYELRLYFSGYFFRWGFMKLSRLETRRDSLSDLEYSPWLAPNMLSQPPCPPLFLCVPVHFPCFFLLHLFCCFIIMWFVLSLFLLSSLKTGTAFLYLWY